MSITQPIFYALTLRKTRAPIHIRDYESKIKALVSDLPLVSFEHHYECDKGLHVHMILAAHSDISIYDIWHLMSEKYGWSVRFEECPNPLRWLQYIRKDQHKEFNLRHTEIVKQAQYDYDKLDYKEMLDKLDKIDQILSPSAKVPERESDTCSVSDDPTAQTGELPYKKLF